MQKTSAEISDWILLRGLSREREHWGEFLSRLRQLLPQYCFHCLDLPGCGEHFREPSPVTVSGIRQHLEQQWLKIAKPKSFGIIGLSLGGMVALEWLAKNPAVAAVVIINSSANDFPPHWRLRPAGTWLGIRILSSCSIERREQLVLQLGSRKYAADEHTLAVWTGIQTQRPVSRQTIVRQLLAAARFSLPVNCNNMPGLVLCSDSDGMVSPRCSEQIALRYGWPLRRNVDAGHDLPLDDPDWVVTEIQRWLGC